VSDADNYAPGTYNDPNAPWNQPDPIEDTDEFIGRQELIWNDRILAIGYMIEAIGETSDDDLKALARLVHDNQNGCHNIAIGMRVTKWIVDYCKPSDDEIIEMMNDEPDERD